MQVDRNVFEELVRLHHAAVYRTARRVVRADADAEDVAQQVFERVLLGKAGLPREPGEAGPALRWLAGRLALNHLRGARRRRVHEEARAMIDGGETERGGVDRAEDRRALRDALGALPDDQRVPVVLRYQDGMTLAAVAGVLGCAESTALMRVRRGLDALRARLRDAGFAAAAASVETTIAEVAVPIAVPAGLEGALLGLTAPVAAAAFAKLGLAAVLVAVIAAGGAMVADLGGGAGAGPVDPRVAIAADRVDADQGPAADTGDGGSVVGSGPAVRTPVPGEVRTPAPDGPLADVATARISGRVIDPDAGLGLAGARVAALSEEPRGKGARFSVQATSDATGRFELELPVAHEGGQAYRIVATHDDHVAFRSERLVARAGDVLPPLRCELRRWAEDVEGAWSMDVTVVDGAGRPVPRATVTMFRLRRLLRSGERYPRESGGRTDDAGRIRLDGDHHGEKVLRVRAPDRDFGPAELSLRIDGPGPHVRVVELGAGLSIEGVVAAVDGGAPIPDLWIEASRDGESTGRGRTDQDGRFVIAGLEPGAHQLGAMLLDWSPFRLDGVLAGRDDVTIQLKRFDDTRAHGDFLGELHGRIVDADSGEPVPVLTHSVRTYWLPPEGDDWRRDVLPGQITPAPMQTAQTMAVQIDGDAPVLRRPAARAEFSRVGIADGRYLLLVYHAEHALGWAGPFELAPGRIESDVVVELPRGATVEGVVRDAAGRAVDGALVWIGGATRSADERRGALLGSLRAEGGAGAGREPSGSVRTDADGYFAIPRVPPGLDLRVHAAHPIAGDGASAALVLRADETARQVDLVMGRR